MSDDDNDLDARIEATLEARYAALLATLKTEAATAFNGWLVAHQASYPGEPPVTAEEIGTVNAADQHSKGPDEWYASPVREVLNDLSHGVADHDEVRALVRFIAWANEDRTPWPSPEATS